MELFQNHSHNQLQGPMRHEKRGFGELSKIIESNEEMIHEQIKIIKEISLDNLNLKKKYSDLEAKYKLLISFIYDQQNLQKIDETRFWTENKINPMPKICFNVEALLDKIADLEKFNELNDNKSIKSDGETECSLKNTSKANHMDTERGNDKKPFRKVNKQNLHNFVSIDMIRKDNDYFNRKRKYSLEQQNLTTIWMKVLDNLRIQSDGKKLRQKTAHLAKKMIPHEIRHRIWPAIFQNTLALNDNFYIEMLERRNSGWVSEQVRIQIQKDISRSFSGRTDYETRVGLSQDVTEVLELFHLFRPDVSYVQGMTYPVIVLTIVVGKVKALTIFSNIILGNSFFRRLFTFEDKFIKEISFAFDFLLKQYCPDLANKLELQNIDSQLFLVEWMFTVFSRVLSFEATLKIWDQIAYFGELAVFRLALSILQILSNRIMETNYEQTLGLIQGFGCFVNESKLIEIFANHKLSNQKLQRTFGRIQKLMKGQK